MQMIKKIIRDLFEQHGFVTGGDIHKNDRAGALHRAWGHVFTNHLKGDYLEFGVYYGDSFIESYKQYQGFRRWLKRQLNSPESWRREVAEKFIGFEATFHGMDTFGGMPKNNEGNAIFAEGTFMSDFNLVYSKCKIAWGGGVGSFKLYQGLFKDTASELKLNINEKAAIINIDCDIYESTCDALNISATWIQVGSVLLFDDYNCYCADNSKGERKAFLEFLENTKFQFEKWFTYQYAGQAYLCVAE